MHIKRLSIAISFMFFSTWEKELSNLLHSLLEIPDDSVDSPFLSVHPAFSSLEQWTPCCCDCVFTKLAINNWGGGLDQGGNLGKYLSMRYLLWVSHLCLQISTKSAIQKAQCNYAHIPLAIFSLQSCMEDNCCGQITCHRKSSHDL